MCCFEAVHALGMLAAVTTPLPPFLFPSNQCNPPKGGKSEECSSTAAFLLPPVPSAGSSLPAMSCFVLEKTPPQCMGACSCPAFAALLVHVLSKSEHLARVFKYLQKANLELCTTGQGTLCAGPLLLFRGSGSAGPSSLWLFSAFSR